jgi:hypothetical protein
MHLKIARRDQLGDAPMPRYPSRRDGEYTVARIALVWLL